MLERLRLNLQRHAEDPKPDDPPKQDPPTPDDDDPPDDGKLTQDQVDKLIEKRLARAKRKWEEDAEAARRREQMSAEERLKAEKEEAEKRAAERVDAANKRAIQAEAKVQAAALGIRPERIAHALRLADLSGVDVDDAGEPDAKTIKTALESVVKDLPELKGSGAGRNGGEFSGGDHQPENLDDKIREAEKAGDLRLARSLKLQKFRKQRE